MAASVKVDVSEAMQALAVEEGGLGLAMLNVDSQTEIIGLVFSSTRPSSILELQQTISTSEPRITFYRFEHQHAGRKNGPFLFFLTCNAPAGVQVIRSRMLYPPMKRAVIEIAGNTCGLITEKRFELEDPRESVRGTLSQ
ncbi:hypothetical protein F5Y06DRAFT_261423 [Hypoxylon sp. FL0890]|nr:hypothetical protein F5Y06DRAFT_261423 [Hypoxylon sp. FL0890]